MCALPRGCIHLPLFRISAGQRRRRYVSTCTREANFPCMKSSSSPPSSLDFETKPATMNTGCNGTFCVNCAVTNPNNVDDLLGPKRSVFISAVLIYPISNVVVMDFGSVSAAISVCCDHNDDNIMKRRERRSRENCDCRSSWRHN